MKILISALSIILSWNSYSENLNLACEIRKPCQYQDAGDLGYCLGSADIVGESMQTMETSPAGLILPLYNIPVKVLKDNYIFGRDETGENWFEIDYNQNREVFEGMVTILEDFPFEIICTK